MNISALVCVMKLSKLHFYYIPYLLGTNVKICFNFCMTNFIQCISCCMNSLYLFQNTTLCISVSIFQDFIVQSLLVLSRAQPFCLSEIILNPVSTNQKCFHDHIHLEPSVCAQVFANKIKEGSSQT